ncbi:hypothetical protein OHB35_43785 [Streptomyces phaeochromogenes]|uniref:Lipoprotein n=1 Tax=Streptomyces phaeochromogenes TaxID=1923 RepID=A0ABZ1HLX5_STRPH|nr:hypothetical protein [Streptomyces phaeochromogenes]WSD19605.1 hypothetical protein OHB35_43785 [Streptomyces phaeochromogenes]
MSMGRGRVGVAGALALMVVLTGCGGGGGDGRDDGSGEGAESSSTRTPSESARPSSQAASPSASATRSPSGAATSDAPGGGTDVDVCFDGRCEITVSKPMTIKVDSRLGVSNLEITKITEDAVILQSAGSGVFLSTSVGEGGTGGLNSLGFRVKSLKGGRAVLEFFPKG